MTVLPALSWSALQNGSDIRGVALDGVPGEVVNLTPAIATALGQAFATWLATSLKRAISDLTIALGRDSRLSGPTLMQAVAEGITSLGARVYDFGLASTPAMFMSTITPGYGCHGAIMLTASHLPFNRNGMKFFTVQGGLEKPDITALLDLAAAGAFSPAPVFGQRDSCDFMAVYAEQLVRTIRQGVNHPTQFDRPLTGLHIVVDAGNGAGGFYVSQVLEPLGADVTGSQFLDPDGTFPNHVPNPEHPVAMAALRQAVLEHRADFGIIFDTDVDRAAAVDAQGQELNRNRLIALMAAIVLQEHPGSTIVTDSITSDGLTQFIETDLQGVHYRFRRGYKNVINEALRLNETGQESWLAIETSGHAALKENYFLDDGAYVVSKLLIELAKAHSAGTDLSARIASLQEPVESREFRITITAEDFQAYGTQVIEHLRTFATTQSDWTVVPNTHEGVRIACQAPQEGGWCLLRLSLHDPVLPLNVESNVPGGVGQICQTLVSYLQGFDGLKLGALGEYGNLPLP
ncbi:phosphomannomutase/phosphoglucomutase [Leptolyngbya sp. PCC 6406]|uniref:phosphomannomutase/phosphoglucomutase n=1 Tax=Leptolyngbya sp. PCC 6406 TaxID=1173264 RepID=UPI0002AC3B0A|nr:phosphomannomutase/phosphoglucomutase [Leptolyngbya sp. PCC 6406]